MTTADDAATGDAPHWEELQRLFDEFADVPRADRDRLIAEAGAGEAIRRRVLALLAAADELADDPPGERPVRPLPSPFIGPYRLVREIGAGGIGAVYLAEKSSDGVTLRSAVKILAPHAVDATFVERFHREQQHLATLEHPNITRLLDAGWSDNGQPYLVMEYVEGEHLDEYCDQRRMNVDARLHCFLQICDAVVNAHRSLIVHLDLKPSNILVTSAGLVKLLDFGTSKLIRIDANATSTVMATPAYSSPEQLLNQAVSTASDVYGLGSILYELLAGRAPFGKISAAARIEAAAREVEPLSIVKAVTPEAALRRSLSVPRLQQLLGGDLAAIVAACLRSHPRDRYPSVDALSDEVQRYLKLQPVLARRQTWTYTAGKLIRRRRGAVAVTCGVLLTVAVCVAYALSQQRIALREGERSVRMQNLMFSLFKMANPDYTGKPVASVPEFLRVGLARLPDYIRDPADLREAQLALAESLYESGDLNDARAAFGAIVASATASRAPADRAEAEAFAGNIDYQLGDIAAGRALTADAVAVSGGSSVPPRVRVLAELYYAFNEDNNGFVNDQNLRLLRAAVAESERHHLPGRERTLALFYLASDLYQRGRGAEAKPIFEQLLPLYEGDPLALCSRSEVYGWLAWISNTTGNAQESLALFRKAYEGYVECSGEDSRGALDELPYWADALIRSGQPEAAVTMLEGALPTWRRVLGGSSEQSEMLYFLARGYVKTGRYGDAERIAGELLALITGKLAPTDRNVGMAHLVMGQALNGERRYAAALPHATQAVNLLVTSAVTAYGREIGAEATRLLSTVQAALATPSTSRR